MHLRPASGAWKLTSVTKVAGVVQAEDSGGTTGAELEGGDGADGMPQAPEAGEIDGENVSEER